MFHHRAAHVLVSTALALVAGCAADAPAPGPAAADADVAPTTDLVVSEATGGSDVADVADVPPVADTVSVLDVVDAATDVVVDVQPDAVPDVPAVVDTVDVLDAFDAATDAVPDVPPDPCAGKNCDDGNACTTDACDGAGVCQHAPLGAGITCATGKVCDAGSACVEVKGVEGMAFIPAGTFWMGCNAVKDASCLANEEPQHKVTLSAYYMDLTETTVAQYKACVDAGGCLVPGYVQPDKFATYPGIPNNPVNYVTWTQSQAYCKWRGAAFDLPTEAQWEMAARGSCEKNGSTASDAGCAAAMRTYPWGETAPTCDYAVMPNGTDGCGPEATWAVGSIPAGDSPYGLHDMAGNVWEWNRDGYGTYSAGPVTDPVGPGSASSRVIRGGSADGDASLVRVGIRVSGPPSGFGRYLGLRCMRSYP